MYTVENREIYKGYEIYTMEVENHISWCWWDSNNSPTFYNGYIIIPEESRYYNTTTRFINNEIKIHEGFTFSEFVDGKFTIGFDTGHSEDNKDTQNVDFVLNELRKAVDQIVEKELEHKTDQDSKEREGI